MKTLCAVVLVGFWAFEAEGATLRLYFSTTGLSSGVLAVIPPEYTTHMNPNVAQGTLVHLYAAVEDAGTWNGIALNYTGQSGGAGISLVNSVVLGLQRWNSGSDFTGQLNGSDPTNLVAVQELGLQNPFPLGQFDNLETQGPAGVEQFYLGSVGSGDGPCYLHVGQQGISRVGGDPDTDLIYFGWGDAPVHGNQIGMASTMYDFTESPEPGTLAGVIAVGAIACGLRRRM